MDSQDRGTELRGMSNLWTYQGQQGESLPFFRRKTPANVSQVIGNFHFSPGRAYQSNQASFQNLVPYLKDKNHHDFGHVINKFQFEGEAQGMTGKAADDLTKSMKKRLGIVNPLDGAVVHPEECKHGLAGVGTGSDSTSFISRLHVPVYVHLETAAPETDVLADFLKVVSTTYNLLSGETVNSHQYSVTQFERDLTQGNAPGKEGHGRELRFPSEC